MKHLFIINPVAGKGNAEKLIPQIKELFKKKESDLFIEITERPGHATELAAKYSKAEKMRVYSVGGDGTLNEILNGISGTDSSLAVIPAGSGNDFIRSISAYNNASELLSKMVNGTEKVIDLATVNGKYFINISSIGFDAEVVHKTSRLKKLPLVSGSMAYILGILSTIITYRNNQVTIVIDGVRIENAILLTAVANGRYYGGGMLAAPEALIDDGCFDICVIDRMKRSKVLRLFPEFMAGRHTTIKGVRFYRGKRVEIESSNPVLLNTDGEIREVNKAVFEIIPNAISIVVPE